MMGRVWAPLTSGFRGDALLSSVNSKFEVMRKYKVKVAASNMFIKIIFRLENISKRNFKK
jgi:hypothetical protein